MIAVETVEVFRKGLEEQTGCKVKLDVTFSKVPVEQMPEGSETLQVSPPMADMSAKMHIDRPTEEIGLIYQSRFFK